MTAFMEWEDMVPAAPDWRIDWRAIESSGLALCIASMKMTPQNPEWHAEGDVWTHTRMVCEALVASEEYQSLGSRLQQELFWAALLHDIGKITCTRQKDGVYISPNHAVIGSEEARRILWEDYGFCGTKERQGFRETVCMLIRYHAVMHHIPEQKRLENKLIRMASNGEFSCDFTIELLCILAKADLCGRICDKTEGYAGAVDFFAAKSRQIGCYDQPFRFPSVFSEYACFTGRDIPPGQEMSDDTWGEVVLACGLDGPKMELWLYFHYDEYPRAYSAESAREFLKAKEPFVWMDTGLTPSIREKMVKKAVNCGASVRIVWFEEEWVEELKGVVVPERFEAHQVEWHCG